jgi:hypothetical protein
MTEQPRPQGTMALRETSIEINLPASLFLRDEPRPDGYQPITNKAWEWHLITKRKLPSDAFRYLWNIARRLDAAHRQFESWRASRARRTA